LIGGLFNDPVAAKELRGFSRRWQTYVGRCLFVGITTYLLYQYWIQAWAMGAEENAPRTVSVSQYAQLGRQIFLRCEWVSLALTVVAAVIAGSDMIAREARNGTLGILLLSDLTPRRVVVGKWKGVLMITVALFFCGLPVQAIAVYLGGVGPADLARSTAYILGLGAVAGAVTIYFSARLKSGGAAVAASIPMMLVMMLAFAVCDLIGTFMIRTLGNPKAIVHQGGVSTVLFSIIMVVVYLRMAIRQVRRRVSNEQKSAEVAREVRALKLQDVRDRRPAKERRLFVGWRAVWDANPLLWKEFTLRPALRVREDYRTRCYIILFSFFLASWVGCEFSESNAFFTLWGSFFTVVALAGGSLLFAPEKEGRQWLLLLSTPVTAIQVVRAKLLCGLIFPEAAGLIFLYLMALTAWLCRQTIYTFLAVAGVASLFLLFAYALAATASLRSRTARAAFLFAGGVAGFLMTVPPLVAAAIRPHSEALGLWNWIEALDPITVLDAFEVDAGRRTIPALAVERSLRFLMLYLPVTLVLPIEMVWRFRQIAIRA
jgi:ABC-type transport system involved in multi-copper enzyme maturation permease subunit